MVVKSQIKFIKSLQQKKYRIENNLFVVEGVKLVNELLDSQMKVHAIYTTDPGSLHLGNIAYEQINDAELRKISGLKNPNSVLAIFHIPKPAPTQFKSWVLALDGVKDPGNMGTIIRLCDWFGITQLLCSYDTVDCYNPKVIQATMGSISRVNVVYADLSVVLKEHSALHTIGAFMEGAEVQQFQWPSSGILVMGNEAHGISETIEKQLSAKIGIPQFGKATVESLNVATATAILLHELRKAKA